MICLALTACNAHVSRTKDQEGKRFRARQISVRAQSDASIMKAAQLTLDTHRNCCCSLLHLSDGNGAVGKARQSHAGAGGRARNDGWLLQMGPTALHLVPEHRQLLENLLLRGPAT